MASRQRFQQFRNTVQLDKEQGWLLGVCAGLANYWRLDAAFVRVGVVVAGLFMPKLIAAGYLVAWLLFDDRQLFQGRDEYR